MAQVKQLTWVELRVGVFVLLSLALLAVGILYITGTGTIGPKYRMKTYLPEVEGVQVGAPVRLDGVEVGSVQEIRINPQPSGKMDSVQLVMRVMRRFQPDIRTDSRASLKTEGLLGNNFVSVTRGFTGSPIQDGGTIQGTEQGSMQQVVQRGSQLLDSLNALTQDIGSMVAKVKHGEGSLGKLINDSQLYDHLNATAVNAQAIVAATQQGKGTVGKLLTSDELYQKVDQTMDDAHAVLGAVRSGNGTLGKMVNDPTMYENFNQFVQRGNSVLAGVQNGQGTLGKLATNDMLYNNLRDASANIRDATAKLNSTTGSAGKFFTDPQLYDNLTGVTADMRALLKDFHENPKKYLRVKFSIF